ncbi:putative hydrophobic protein (TIGR00341 family) [Blastomonas natatoria]|uniref:Putative hydrophobic protein (TIGR00341 family) n=1 Tax=Blastomonas natatoria TaxID=34015 RepID=A0A2V3V8L0_9SPHN|nr:DUF389 domain-containing protein [Blastomonas natatoria]PXW78116.1 putative hydrophobic protein (TIGR00341 family) [Blastomonas natatoria]
MSQSTSSDAAAQAVPGNGTSLGRFAARVAGPLGGWWRASVIPSIEHRAVIAKVDDEASLTPRYAFMILMSAGIAVLGLLLSSPAVVIGAMLISPLMGPIIGLGFGMALVDGNEIRRTAMTLAGGVLLAILFSALVVFFSPIKDITPEIAARTRPNLFDLLVALFSALAGAYAMIRGREGTIVGVAIATALMPPLATVGFGLATLNGTVFFGSLLLFVTNLMTIAIAAAIMARLYGFGPKLTSRQSGMQAAVIIAVLLGLAIPLGYSLSQIAWEARAQRQARDVLAEQFPRQAKIDQLEIDFSGEPLAVRATVLTPEYRAKAAAQGETLLARALGRPVKLSLDQFRVGTAAGDAEAAQIASASAREQTRKERATAALVGRELAILAGVAPEAVLIDRDKRLAQVRAASLPGATLATYRALEQRLAAAEPQWKMQLVPPPLPLPVIGMDGDELTDDGADNLALAIWAARRTGIPVIVSGRASVSQIVLTRFKEAGIDIESNESSNVGDDIRLTWALQTEVR